MTRGKNMTMRMTRITSTSGREGLDDRTGRAIPRRHPSAGSAFTLIEMLVVMVILGILAAILTPVVKNGLRSARKNQARTEVKAIETAVRAYLQEYGKLPIPNTAQGGAEPNEYLAEGTNSNWIIKVLTYADPQGFPENTTMNQRGIVFLDTASNAKEGTFLDPWGRQYALHFDSDYTSQVLFDGETLPTPVVVYSYGENKAQDNWKTGDDIVSYYLGLSE